MNPSKWIRFNYWFLPFVLVSCGKTAVLLTFSPTSVRVGELLTIRCVNCPSDAGLATGTFTIGGVTGVVVSASDTSAVVMVMPGSVSGSVGVTADALEGWSAPMLTMVASGVPATQQGAKVVATGLSAGALFGSAVALSADGETAIVGARNENAAVVFTRSGTTWTQQAKLTGTGATGTPDFGNEVALSADGNTAAVGGSRDDSSSGAFWVFTRSNGAWTPQGSKITATGISAGSGFGSFLELSADGNTALVGAPGDNGAVGAALVFKRTAETWTQTAKLVGSGAVGVAAQGTTALSADGKTAMLGGSEDDSSQGAAWVFTETNGVWTQQGAKLVGTGAVGAARQGGVALSADGNTALLGGADDDSGTGAVWVFTRSAGVWSQQGEKLVGTGAAGPASQGYRVASNAEGTVAVVSADGDGGNDGAAWVFARTNGVWAQAGNKLFGTGAIGAADQGKDVAVSPSGMALVGGTDDDSNLGAVWVYVP